MNKTPRRLGGKHSINMKLSSHFELSEFTRSETADKLGIYNGLDWSDSAWIVDNLERLCVCALEPLRRYLDEPIFISSGYRCPRLNEAVGGSRNSQHRIGEAADIYFSSFKEKWFEAVIYLITSPHVPFDQLIIYPTFLHISVSSPNRREVLDYRNR